MIFRPPRKTRRIGVSSKATISAAAHLGSDVDVHAGATVADDVEIGEGSTIHAGVHIMAGCKIGEHVTIYPNAVLYEDTIVGPRSVIHAGAVIGAHGFGYKLVDGRHELASQFGWVELGADVEVGAGSTIDRGTYGPTVVGEGTKIDNLVMVAHNCRIGRHNMLCSQVGIAGSTTTGRLRRHGRPGGRARPRTHRRGAVLGAMSGITADVPRRSPHAGRSRHAGARAEADPRHNRQAARAAPDRSRSSPRPSSDSRATRARAGDEGRVRKRKCRMRNDK